ncbi:hypothetical protein ACN27F_34125 [Solwaraspora sp. WMMB335]|uniref:hypothetical protein n=1 Tax=Solwaraspora sp. WMMB335 TaxID=3404118 RepID=UPI003B948C0E
MTATGILTAPTDLARGRAVAREAGIVAALTFLHAELGGALLPAGPSGHVFVPEGVARRCDTFSTPDGPRVRAGATERRLAEVRLGPDTMVALSVPGGGPGGGPGGDGRPDAWSIGLGWVRLGLAERFLAQAAEHLRGRRVQETVTLNLPPVRVLLADAAAGLAEAHALLATGPDEAALYRTHRALDEAGRVSLHLFGATGFLAEGPGSEIRAAELLGETYGPPCTEGVS